MLTLVETKDFSTLWPVYWSEEELGEFCLFLAQHPLAGAVIQGTRGCRKVRWSVKGHGKRGGVRVIYVNRLDEHTIWLLTMYSKAVKADVERKALSKLRESIHD